MTNSSSSGWRAIIGSSAIMSLALLGDALLYAVLPAYASDFGLTLPWVGVMLSANRFSRLSVRLTTECWKPCRAISCRVY
jgi:hypothetical protein